MELIGNTLRKLAPPPRGMGDSKGGGYRAMKGVLPPLAELLAGTQKESVTPLDEIEYQAPIEAMNASVEVPAMSGFPSVQGEDVTPPEMDTTPQPAGKTYVIAKGDTLWRLAQREYGNADFWKEIAAANGITDPTKLQIGQELIIPDLMELDGGSGGPEAMAREPIHAPVPRPRPPVAEALVASMGGRRG